MKSLTWVQGGDFRTWWFEDRSETKVGPIVKEDTQYLVIGDEGEVLGTRGSLQGAKELVEILIQESMRP